MYNVYRNSENMYTIKDHNYNSITPVSYIFLDLSLFCTTTLNHCTTP